jgi:hypothetical protein
MLCGSIFRRAFPLLRGPLAPHRGVTNQIAGRLLASAEQFVEKSHLDPPTFWSRTRFELAVSVKATGSTKNAKAGEPEGSSALARRA